jgi:hypothetical protein
VKTSSILICFLIFLGATSAVGQSTTGLYCPEPNWDWGGVGIDFEISHTYLVINAGKTRAFIDSVIAPCDCSLARPSDSTLNPGDTARINLKFSTRDFYGRTTKQVDVYWRDSVRHYLQFTYSATVGQYFGGLKPDPVSVFVLPTQASRKVIIPNPKLSLVEIGGILYHTDIAEVKLIKSKARAGENLELEVTPKPGLTPGTYLSNFRLEIRVEGERRPLLITMPTKIVRY